MTHALPQFRRILALVLILGGFAYAQGSDDCASATAIAGTGDFAFDNQAATQGVEAQANALCNQFGATNVGHDVWFQWTAPATGAFTISTCGSTTVDTKLAVFNGSACPAGAPLACSDDGCGLQSRVAISATLGSAYRIQLGTYPTSPGGTGLLQIASGGIVCAPSGGANLIVGDIHSIANHAAAGSLDAISLGTFACNVGAAPLAWVAATSQHPVFGSTLYRYRVQDGSGRFEQIGTSWLKHGFAASTNSLCCTCTPPGAGSQLGVGCADPYDAGVNGTQASLGPRWQVNARTGVFAYPPANPVWSGTTARRLEFESADADVAPGVRYFAESQCVAADDSAASNQNDNVSFRELSASGSPGNVSFALYGQTQRGRPAIRAWAEIDPGVTLSDVPVPGDGRLVVGSRVTDLGGGMWHYEYAVHNQNSDRNGGAFSVLVPVGSNVQNVGFHGVVYRNGDGPGGVDVSSASWSANVGSASISWSCEAFDLNPAANAIRWGSTYNFRFDIDAAPMNGNVNLALWKPGTPGAVDVVAQVPTGGVLTSFPYCFGDASGTLCPCFNDVFPGTVAGCANSFGPGGQLLASGAARIGNDTLVLNATGLPPSTSCLVFQGTAQTNGGSGVLFGNGLRCASGTIIRLATKTVTAGTVQYPAGGEEAIGTRGLNVAGNVRTYQVWYRNQDVFCTLDHFNLTNGWQETWTQ